MKQLIAPSSGGFSARFLTLRDFTRSPWKSSVEPYTEKDKALNKGLWGSLPKRLEQAISHWSWGAQTLPFPGPISESPGGLSSQTSRQPTCTACASTASPSASQHQYSSKKPDSSLLETHKCVSNRLPNSQVSSNILVLTQLTFSNKLPLLVGGSVIGKFPSNCTCDIHLRK